MDYFIFALFSFFAFLVCLLLRIYAHIYLGNVNYKDSDILDDIEFNNDFAKSKINNKGRKEL